MVKFCQIHVIEYLCNLFFLLLQNIFVHILDLSDSKGVHTFAADFCTNYEALHGLVSIGLKL